MKMVKRIPYEHTEGVDVGSELEKLRRHYADLQNEKVTAEKKAVERAMRAEPSEVQRRLYQKGVHKLISEKLEEEKLKATRRKNISVDRNNINPSPVHNRLYEDGMIKVLAGKDQEQKRIREGTSATRRRAMSSSPVCERLYKEGLAKVQAAKKRESRQEASSSSRSTSSTPSSACNRLYDLGKAQLISRRNLERHEQNVQLSLPSSPRTPSPAIERLYAQGKAKLRAQVRRNSEKSISRTKSAARSPSQQSVTSNSTCERLYEHGKNKLRSSSNCRLPPRQNLTKLNDSTSPEHRFLSPTDDSVISYQECNDSSTIEIIGLSDDSGCQGHSAFRVRDQSPCPVERGANS